MRGTLFFIAFFLLRYSNCNESESFETSQIEFSPFYDTIIFSDVLDIINELHNNNSPSTSYDDSKSESDENVEDLLSEYQHYIDKAHEQRRLYLEKMNKTKNKVPPLKHENFIKINIPADNKYKNDHFSQKYPIIKKILTAFKTPLDLLMPLNTPFRYINKLESNFEKLKRKEFEDAHRKFNQMEIDDKKPINFSDLISLASNNAAQSSCFCNPSYITCQCNCKQCFVPFGALRQDGNENTLSYGGSTKMLSPNTLNMDTQYANINNKQNALNIRIKLDIQIPKASDGLINNNKIYNSAEQFNDDTKELDSSIRLPTTYFNVPIPLEVYGLKSDKDNKHESRSMQKIMIHKKKKQRLGNNNKRHRKKLITFHNIKLSPSSHTSKPIILQKNNINNMTIPKFINISSIEPNVSESTTTTKITLTNFTITSTELTTEVNSTQMEELYFMLNISNNNNETEDEHKIGNSIELEYKTFSNNNSTPNYREKRATIIQKELVKSNNNSSSQLLLNQGMKWNKKTNIKIINSILSDTDLLYWPTHKSNSTVPKIGNITEIILERENKKVKLNIAQEAIHKNPTMALQSIFGQVDWSDVDTVAPPFISFVGKYINGVLTFCSEKICHSIKCGNKICVHRTCTPGQRFNLVGHCNGSNETDTIASMEAIMDLPSNVAHEIVDILQDKMLGNIFGKATLCVTSKCNSFLAAKKTFIKSKCVAKELNKAGHCPNLKKS